MPMRFTSHTVYEYVNKYTSIRANSAIVTCAVAANPNNLSNACQPVPEPADRNACQLQTWRSLKNNRNVVRKFGNFLQ